MTSKKKKSKRNRSEKLFFWLLVGLPLLQFAVFYIGVNFNSILLAFKSYNATDDTQTWVWFDNFVSVWKELADGTLLVRLGNSVLVWLLTTVLGTVIAVVFSYYIFKKRFAHKTFKFMLFLPTVLPSVLLTTVFVFFAQVAWPPIAKLFTGEENALLYSDATRMPAVMLYTLFIGLGTQVLLYSGSMEQIDPSMLEAAKIDGAPPIVEFTKIVVPQILGTISTFLIAGIATIFTNQAHIYEFYGVGVSDARFTTIGYYLFRLVNIPNLGNYYYPYAAALGLCCTLVALPLTLLAKKGLDKLAGN